MSAVTQKNKDRAKALRTYIDNVKKFEDDKEYSSLKLAENLWEVRENNAHCVVLNFPDGLEGFKEYCKTNLKIGYHSAMSYIRIHNMRITCNLDPAEAEELGYAKLRTITPIARLDNIEAIMEEAKKKTTSELEDWVKKYKKQMALGAPSGSDDEPASTRRFSFMASDEEVNIIETTLNDVKALLNNRNDTSALTHIMQGYMEFVYPNEREQILSKLNEGVGTKNARKEVFDDKSKSETLVESDTDINTASLAQLVSLAEAKGITLSDKDKINKKKIQALLITQEAEHTSEEPATIEGDQVDFDDSTDIVEETLESEEVPEVVETPEVFDTETVAPSAEKKKGRPAKTKVVDESTEKNTKKASEKKKDAPSPEVVDPSAKAKEDEADNISFEDAMKEIRGVKDKKELKSVATSWGLKFDDKDWKATDIETLIEVVAKLVCKKNDVEYIPPVPEDTSDLDDMLAGK